MPAFVTSLLVLLACLCWPGAAAASALPTLGHQGRWLTDPQGRVVILHGAQVDRFKGFADADRFNIRDLTRPNVRFLAAQGFNLARPSISYMGVEPVPGQINERYIGRYLQLDRWLASARVWDLVDLQQGQYSPVVAGNGFPDWMAITGGATNNREPYSRGYLDNPAEEAVWDNFWADAQAVDGKGLQRHYVRGMRLLASRFADAPALLGLEIVNEPWPGTRWPTCAQPGGCPPGGFDQSSLAGFYRRVIPRMRAADPSHLIVYEPNLLFDFGAATGLPTLPDNNLVFGFHNYCLGSAPGLTSFSDPVGACGTNEQVAFDNADARASSSGDALLMDEWGNNTDPALNERVSGEADQHMVGWNVWAYEDCCNSPAAFVKDGTKPPSSPGNLNLPVLRALVRAYPQSIAGTPTGWSYDPGTRQFQLTYSTARAGGGQFGGRPLTQIEIPPLHYPSGYDVQAQGARVVSAPDSDPLLLRARPGATTVQVTVNPARHHPRAGSVPGKCPRRRPVVRIGGHGQGPVRRAVLHLDRRRVLTAHGRGAQRMRLPAGLTNGTRARIVATTTRGARVTVRGRIRGCGFRRGRTRVHTPA